MGLAFLFLGLIPGPKTQAVIFNREIALSVGIPASLVFYSVLFTAGATITASLQSIGGLLIFNLIINPAAAAYQITYNLKTMFVLAALFDILASWLSLFVSYLLDIPSGATIALISVVIFVIAAVFSPKRRVKRWLPDRNLAVER